MAEEVFQGIVCQIIVSILEVDKIREAKKTQDHGSLDRGVHLPVIVKLQVSLSEGQKVCLVAFAEIIVIIIEGVAIGVDPFSQ